MFGIGTARDEEGWKVLTTNPRSYYDGTWSCLVEGDEQLDWPNNQTFMECCRMHLPQNFVSIW